MADIVVHIEKKMAEIEVDPDAGDPPRLPAHLARRLRAVMSDAPRLANESGFSNTALYDAAP